MEEIEILSWVTLDALGEAAEVVETVGDLQSGHSKSIFCIIEDDYLELCYNDTAANFLRRYEDKEEFQSALEQRKEEFGDAPYEESNEFEEESLEEIEKEEDYDENEEM